MPRAPKARRAAARPAKGTRHILVPIRTRSRRPPNAPSDATRVGVAVSRYAVRSPPAPAPPARRRDAGSTRYGCTAYRRNSLAVMRRTLWCLTPGQATSSRRQTSEPRPGCSAQPHQHPSSRSMANRRLHRRDVTAARYFLVSSLMDIASREWITLNRGVVVCIQVWRVWPWLPPTARRRWPGQRNCMTSIRPRRQFGSEERLCSGMIQWTIPSGWRREAGRAAGGWGSAGHTLI